MLCRSVSRNFIEFCLETTCWCSTIVHQSNSFSDESAYVSLMCMNTSSNVTEMFRLLKFIGTDKLQAQTNYFVSWFRKFEMVSFRNKRLHRTKNLKKDLFLDHCQPPVDKNSKLPCDFDFTIWWRHCENHLYGGFVKMSGEYTETPEITVAAH